MLRSSQGGIEHVVAPHAGTFVSAAVKQGDVVKCLDVAHIEFCPHRVVYGGLCAVCGEEAEPAHFAQPYQHRLSVDQRNSVALSVTRDEAESVSSLTARRLFKSKRLSLVLDLDHTLVHAVDDARAELLIPFSPPHADRSSISSFSLSPPHTKRMMMYLKFRPYLKQFLERISVKFELHIYTMGSRRYADKVAHLIDPSKELFSGRIVSRDDFAEGKFNKKSIKRLFPCDDSMAVVIDDREDVWVEGTGQEYLPNLIRAEPYYFWDGLKEAYDRASNSYNANRQKISDNHALQNGGDDVNGDRSLQCLEEVESTQGTDADAEQDEQHTRQVANGNEQGNGLSVGPENGSPTEEAKPNPANGPATGPSETAIRTPLEAPNSGSSEETQGQNGAVDEGGTVAAPTTLVAAETDEQKGSTTKSDCQPAPSIPGEERKESDEVAPESASNGKTEKDISTVWCKPTVNNRNGETSEELSSFVSGLEKEVQKWWENDACPKTSKHLLRLAEVLEECHSSFFSSPASQKLAKALPEKGVGGKGFQAPCDVKRLLATMRLQILKDCVITFSGVIPLDNDVEASSEWKLALRLGARCCKEFVNGYTTHVVAADEGLSNTKKCRQGLESGNTFVVTLKWFYACALNFERQMELGFCAIVDDRFNNAQQHRKTIEEGYEIARRLLRKRDSRIFEQDVQNSKRAHHMYKTQTESTPTPPPSPRMICGEEHIVSGDEIAAAMELAMESDDSG